MNVELLIVLGLGALMYVISTLTRPSLYFANTVNATFRGSPEAKQILRTYRLDIVKHSCIAALIAVAGAWLGKPFVQSLAIPWLLAGSAWSAWRGYRATKPYAAPPSPLREASLSVRTDISPITLVLALLPFAILAAAAVYANFHWSEIPARIATHYGFGGPDKWVDRNPRNVYGIILVFASVCLILLMTAYGAVRGTRMIASQEPEISSELRFKRLMLMLLISLEYLTAMPVWSVLFGSTVDPHGWSAAWPFLVLAVTGAAIGLSIWMGQGGRRLPPTGRTFPLEMSATGDRTPDSCWKWGLFYYNPTDPAVFVEKRFGIGYTVNFANVRGLAFISLTVVPIALGYFLIR